MNVKLVHLVTGAEIIADVEDIDNSMVRLNKPLIYIPVGEGAIKPFPFPAQGKGPLEVKRMHIVFICEALEPIVESYNKFFSNIVTPPSKLALPPG